MLAHELTHVVQQNGSAVQRKTNPSADIAEQISEPPHEVVSAPSADIGIQRLCHKCEQKQQQLSIAQPPEERLQAKEIAGYTININPDLPSLSNPSLQPKQQVTGESQEQETAKEQFAPQVLINSPGGEPSPTNAEGTELPPDSPEQPEARENALVNQGQAVKTQTPKSTQSVEIATPQDKSPVKPEDKAAAEQGEGLENTPASQAVTPAGTDEPSPKQNPEEIGKAVAEQGKELENTPASQALEQAVGSNEASPKQNPEEISKTASPGTEDGKAVAGQGEGLENTPILEQTAGTDEQSSHQNPEEIGKTASPETATEQEQAISAVAETQAQQTAINTQTTQLVSTTINFAPPQQQTSDDAELLEQQRVEATNITNEFFAAAALRMQTITQLGEGISATIQGAAENAKASVMATVEQQKATVTAQIAQQRDQAESEAQAIIAQIQAQYQVALATTSPTTATGRQKVETENTTSLQKLAESENNQLARMEEFYAQAGEKYRAAGEKVGNEAIALGEQKASAWESQIKNEDDSILDGPLTDNRLRAKAKAAREVAKQYKDGLIQEANKQADAVGQGKAKDIAAIHNVANQSRQQLQTLQQQSLDNLNAVEQQVLSQLEQAQTQLTQTANQTRQTTLQTLNQQQAAHMQLLDAYGQRQVLAIDRDGQKAIASIQAGINQATTNLQTVLQDTQNQLQAMPAPPPAELSAALADILAQFDDAVAQVQNQTAQGIAASEQGIIGGGQQVVTGVRAIAQTGLQESAAVAEQAKNTLTNLHQGAVNTFNQIQQTFTTTINKTSETAVTGFAQTTQGVDTAFNQVNQNLDSNFQKATNDLEAGLRGALQGAKQPNLESDIEKSAQQAADQEQPRWKTVLKKVLLVIAVIVVAIVVAPAVIGAVGAVAGALGASAAAAGTIGAVVGGAIVGAVAGAVIQVGNNAIDGKNLLDGVGQAALVGAIGGALGGAGGVLGNALGQAGKLGAGKIQSFLKFGIDAAFDIAGSIAGDLAVGDPITLMGILIGAGMGAAVQISTANLGKLGSFGRNVEAMQTRTFQAGEQFGTSLGGKVKGAFGGVDAPKVGSNDAGVGGVQAPETGLPKGDRPQLDTPGSTKSDLDMPSVKQPESEVKPQTNIPSGRTTHLDEPEIEPGVVAKRSTADGHEIKVLKDGRVVRCSDCEEMDISPEAAKAPNSQEKLEQAHKEAEATVKSEKQQSSSPPPSHPGVELHNHFNGILAPEELIALKYGNGDDGYTKFLEDVWEGESFNDAKALFKHHGLTTEDSLKTAPANVIEEVAVKLLTANEFIAFDKAYVYRRHIISNLEPELYVEATLKQLQADNIRYIEVQGDLPKDLKYTTFQDMLKQYGVEVRFLKLIPSKTLAYDPQGKEIKDAGGIEKLAETKAKTILGKIQLGENGNIGLDFAGPEAKGFTDQGKEVFKAIYRQLVIKANDSQISLVLRPHVGEGYAKNQKTGSFGGGEHRQIAENNLDKIIQALKEIQQAEGLSKNVIIRFGHATHATPEQLQAIQQLGVIVEANLTSNLVTKSVADELEMNQVLLKFLYHDVKTILNTDGGGVMSTSLKNEYNLASRIIGDFRNNVIPLTIDEVKYYYDKLPDEDARDANYEYKLLPEDKKNNFDIERLKQEAESYSKKIAPNIKNNGK